VGFPFFNQKGIPLVKDKIFRRVGIPDQHGTLGGKENLLRFWMAGIYPPLVWPGCRVDVPKLILSVMAYSRQISAPSFMTLAFSSFYQPEVLHP
jgi:hypothetical protein